MKHRKRLILLPIEELVEKLAVRIAVTPKKQRKNVLAHIVHEANDAAEVLDEVAALPIVADPKASH